MRSEYEKIEREALKNILKIFIMNNQQMTSAKKQQVMDRIDVAAEKADWIMELVKRCGYL